MASREAYGFHVIVQDHRTDEIYREFCYLETVPYRTLPFNYAREVAQMDFIHANCPEYRFGYHGEPDCSYSAIQRAHDARLDEEKCR